MKIASTFVATILVLSGCGKKDNSNSAETGTVKATEETTEEDAATDETTSAVELPILNVEGALALAIAGDSGAKLNLTGVFSNESETESNLRKINADGTDAPAMGNTELVTQEVIVGPSDQVYVVFKAVDPVETTPRDYTTTGPNDAEPAKVATPVGVKLLGEKVAGEIRKYASAPFVAQANIATGVMTWLNPEIVVPFTAEGHNKLGLQFDEKGGVYYKAGVDPVANAKREVLSLIRSKDGVNTILYTDYEDNTVDENKQSELGVDITLGAMGDKFKVVDSQTVYFSTRAKDDPIQGESQIFKRINPETKEVKTISGIAFPITVGTDGKVYSTKQEFDAATNEWKDILRMYDPATEQVTTVDVVGALCQAPDEPACPSGFSGVHGITSYGDKIIVMFGQLIQIAPSIVKFGEPGFDIALVISASKMVLVNDYQKLFIRDDVAGTPTALVLDWEVTFDNNRKPITYLAQTNQILFEAQTVPAGGKVLVKYDLATGANTVTTSTGYSSIQSLSK
jgi:hypothetical protein